METLLFIILAILPPFISGPLPTLVLFSIMQSKNWRWRFFLWLLLAIALNGCAYILMIESSDGLLPPVLFACSLTPIVALATFVASLIALRRGYQAAEDSSRRRWLRVGIIAIPLLQLFTLAIMILIAPALCGTSIRNCSRW